MIIFLRPFTILARSAIMKRKKKTLKVLIVAEHDTVKRALTDYYARFIRPRCIQRYGCDLIYVAKNVLQAQRKIERGFDLHMIVFSHDFSKEETDTFREWLSFRQLAIPFVFVPIRVALPVS